MPKNTRPVTAKSTNATRILAPRPMEAGLGVPQRSAGQDQGGEHTEQREEIAEGGRSNHQGPGSGKPRTHQRAGAVAACEPFVALGIVPQGCIRAKSACPMPGLVQDPACVPSIRRVGNVPAHSDRRGARLDHHQQAVVPESRALAKVSAGEVPR